MTLGLADSAPAPDRPCVGLIWAQAEGGVIGVDGTMPWHVPEDLAHFKAVTLGNPVVMGRQTWDSLDPRFRPLPGRRNIVITRQPDWTADGADVAHSLELALNIAEQGDADRTWIIGGGQVYRASIAVADVLEVTEINARYHGDAFAPEIDGSWVATQVDPPAGWHDSRTGIQYRFLRYERV